MSLISKIKDAVNGKNQVTEYSPEGAGQKPEETEPVLKPTEAQEKEEKEDSGQKIIGAVEELLARMQSRQFKSELSPDEKISIETDFQNIQKVIAGCQCEYDVTSLDENILQLVRMMEGQLEESAYGEWKDVLSVIKDAVRARINGEFEIAMASLDIVEKTLELTNESIDRKIKESKNLLKESSDEMIRGEYNVRISLLEKDKLINKHRIEQIRQRKVQLKDKRSILTKGELEKIDLELDKIRNDIPDLIELLAYDIEAMRNKTIQTKVEIAKAQEVLKKAQEAQEVIQMEEQVAETIEQETQKETITE